MSSSSLVCGRSIFYTVDSSVIFTCFTNFLNLALIGLVLGLVDILALKFDSLYWKHVLGESFTTETKLVINVIVNWCSLMHDCVV